MKRFDLENKGRRTTQDGLNARLELFYTKLEQAELRGSTGSTADAVEVAVRHILRASGLAYNDVRVHRANEHDVRVRRNGKLYSLEVKTGNGIIGYTRTEQILPEYCKLDELIVYLPDPKSCDTIDDILDNSAVFFRAEFIDFIGTAGLKRSKGNFASGCKLGVNSKALREENRERKAEGLSPLHDCICLHPSYQKARMQAIQSGEYLTLRSFLMEEFGES